MKANQSVQVTGAKASAISSYLGTEPDVWCVEWDVRPRVSAIFGKFFSDWQPRQPQAPLRVNPMLESESSSSLAPSVLPFKATSLLLHAA